VNRLPRDANIPAVFHCGGYKPSFAAKMPMDVPASYFTVKREKLLICSCDSA